MLCCMRLPPLKSAGELVKVAKKCFAPWLLNSRMQGRTVLLRSVRHIPSIRGGQVIKRAAIFSEVEGMNIASLLALIRVANTLRCERGGQRGGGGYGGLGTAPIPY